MTDPVMADHVYLKPLTTKSIKEILSNHKIDAVLPTMGGQSALNLCIEADEKGIWKDFNVEIIGVDIDAINICEDREQFKQLLKKIDIPVAPAKTATSFLKGKEIAQEFGFPLVIRPSFTLGGSGASLVYKAEDFDELLTRGLEASPIHEVLIDKALMGWKEYELELLRDKNDNVVIICTIENMDPMGIHTGDSITVAPAMTLSDTAYQRMRDMAIKMMRSIGDFAGGCNVQFTVNPEDGEMLVIEMNPRVSRSSALASKATGFPIAKVAAKLAVGYTLDELKNDITGGIIPASFEPSIDYVVTKIPRFNFEKFPQADNKLTTQMKSVGEVMAIGRNFQESLQKAIRGLETGRDGLNEIYNHDEGDLEFLKQEVAKPSPDRLWYLADALRAGLSEEDVFNLCKVDPWFIYQISDLVLEEKKVLELTLNDLDHDNMLSLKKKGFSDSRLATLLQVEELEVRNKRKELLVSPVFKRVDTCAAEFESSTAYMYSTYEEECESLPSTRERK